MVARMVRHRKIRAELGVSSRVREPLARVHYAERVLCYSVAELDYPFPMPPHVRLVGTMVPPLPQATNGGEIIAWLDAQSSVIYQAFGTIARLTRAEIAALVDVARRLEGRHQVLWKLPAEQQRMLPSRALPGNLRIESWLPSQLDVLAHPHVTLFFNHSGTGAYHEGLYFGKPQVTRPLWMDCHDIAARSRGLGIGLMLDRPDTIDPDDVTDKLLRVLGDPSFRERAEHFATLLRAAGGRKAAADILLELPALKD
jgi:polyene glycosyltransferase